MPTHASQDNGGQCPSPCGRPLLTHASAGDPQMLTDWSCSACYGAMAPSPGSWCAPGPVCALQEPLFPLVLWKFCDQIPLSFKIRFPGDSQSLCWIPRLGSLMWGLEPLQQCKNLWYYCSPVCGPPTRHIQDLILL